jgi:proteasome-associated ATPase
MSMAARMLEEIGSVEEGSMSLDDRLALLARLRESGMENPAGIDRFLLDRIGRLNESLSMVKDQHSRLRGLIDELTAPPYYPAVYLSPANTPTVQGAMVQTDHDRRVVQLAEGVSLEQLRPGDEVFLSHERNCLIAISSSQSFRTGDVAIYCSSTSDGRLVLRFHDEKVMVLATAELLDSELKAGDFVRYNRSMGLAFEKIDLDKENEYFIENTPRDTFDNIGGLDREIEELKRLLTLHIFHPELAAQYNLKRKKSVLMEGPPGNGKTTVARALCNWLASLTPGGRSLFINVKPGGLNNEYFGATERHYREIFRIAREAAEENPLVPVVMFFDEIDSIGGNRGESFNRIDDRLLNAFMAELQGFEDSGNIVVIAATNRMDSLDPALLRPGRLGDLILHFPQPNGKAARAILSRHLSANIPYATNGENVAAAREALLDMAIAQLYAQNSDTELARVKLRDGKERLVRAADLLTGSHLHAIAQAASQRACIRGKEGGSKYISAADMQAAISDFFITAPRALTPRNARNFLRDLPQDIDVVRVDLIERKVRHPHLYCVEAA